MWSDPQYGPDEPGILVMSDHRGHDAQYWIVPPGYISKFVMGLQGKSGQVPVPWDG